MALVACNGIMKLEESIMYRETLRGLVIKGIIGFVIGFVLALCLSLEYS